MDILRVPPYQINAVLEVGAPAGTYTYTIEDMADHSVTTGTVTSTSTSKVSIALPSEYDNQYTITIDGDEHIIDVVRPYVDANTKGTTATEIQQYAKNEELARAIIDSIIQDGFYYKKKNYETVGVGADLLPIWPDLKKLLYVYENNVLIFDAANAEDYMVKYELTRDNFGLQQRYDDVINRNQSAPNILPAGGSDMLELNFVYRGFPKEFDYSVVGLFGYKKIPSDIVKATELLIEDIECGKLDYYKRYVADYSTDQFKIKFDTAVFEGTGNILVDKILSKYKKSIRTIGVL
jgi:hypothetical protein